MQKYIQTLFFQFHVSVDSNYLGFTSLELNVSSLGRRNIFVENHINSLLNEKNPKICFPMPKNREKIDLKKYFLHGRNEHHE